MAYKQVIDSVIGLKYLTLFFIFQEGPSGKHFIVDSTLSFNVKKNCKDI